MRGKHQLQKPRRNRGEKNCNDNSVTLAMMTKMNEKKSQTIASGKRGKVFISDWKREERKNPIKSLM